jgi:hypothetical protein
MHSLEADEAMIHCKEEVGIETRQMREHIKSGTIYSYEHRGREMRLGEKLDPVDVVVIGHVLLSITLRRLTSLCLGDSYRSVTRGISANNKTMDRIARTRG